MTPSIESVSPDFQKEISWLFEGLVQLRKNISESGITSEQQKQSGLTLITTIEEELLRQSKTPLDPLLIQKTEALLRSLLEIDKIGVNEIPEYIFALQNFYDELVQGMKIAKIIKNTATFIPLRLNDPVY